MNKLLLEKSILGTMIQENYWISDIEILPEMFVNLNHRLLYTVMQNLVLQNIPVDTITLSIQKEVVEKIGLPAITEMLQLADAERFEEYVLLLRKQWAEQKKQTILNHALQANWSIERILHELDQIQIYQDYANADITENLTEMYDLPYKDITMNGVIVPHIDSLAKLIDGFKPGELTILAARPSMGKTDVMNNLALYAGWNGALPIIFSLEMNKKSLINRLVATVGNISRLKMRNPKEYLTDEQKERWPTALSSIKNSNILIDDRSDVGLTQIRAQARRLIRQHPDKKPIIFIDYLQIIQSDTESDYMALVISKISRGLKQIAKDLNCPIVCLSQLNRNVESRADKRPIMSDLRDSGSIEQDADIIIFLYRETYYEKEEDNRGDTLELIVAKNRNGPTGTAYAKYFMKTGHVICVKDARIPGKK